MSTALRRLLALVGAVVLVVGALWIHGDFDSAGGGGAENIGPSTGRLLCTTELAAACEQLARDAGVQFDVASAGDTVTQLSTLADADRGSYAYDGWLTFARDAEIVRDARQRAQLAPLLGASDDVLARSPLVLAIWKDRADALRSECGGDVTWKCLGNVAGVRWSSVGGQSAWGDVKIGHADPQTTAEGLVVIGQAATQFFGRIDLSKDDYDNSDPFLEWFSRLERAVPAGGGVGDQSPFVRMLTAGPAAFDVVATTEATAGPELAHASRDRRDAVRLLYPAPVSTADVVFAPIVGRSSDLADTVTGGDGRHALAAAGFRVDGESRARGVPDTPPLPSRPNLPDAGSLEALLATWREVTG